MIRVYRGLYCVEAVGTAALRVHCIGVALLRVQLLSGSTVYEWLYLGYSCSQDPLYMSGFT